MNTLFYKWLASFLVTIACLPVFGQAIVKNSELGKMSVKGVEQNYVITRNDEKYIKSNAEAVVKRFMDLLNFISTSLGLEALEVENIIQNSFSQADSKIFYDSASVVEDDLHIVEKDRLVKEKVVLRYLRDFDLLYRKTNEATVVFNNFEVSNVKSKDFLYIKVFYSCLFNNTSRISGQPYGVQKRVAELKVEKQDNIWKAWITNIHFPDSLEIVNAAKNDVLIPDDPQTGSPSVALPVSEVALNAGKKENTGIDLTNSTSRELFNYYMKEALFAESLRNYDESLKNYKLALAAEPESAKKINAKIKALTLKIDNLAKFESKYMAGQYKEAINDYDNAIRKDENNADYYFGRGKCFEKSGDVRQAMKDYMKVISIDPDHLQAYKMKGALNEFQGAYEEAIADYKICAALDKNNITLYHKIASLYVSLGNLDAAVVAFDKAISINDKIAFLFHMRGELLYKLNKVKEAELSFSNALKLDSAKAASYFYRGLCRIDLKNPAPAAEDFTKAKRLNLEESYKQRIQQIGESFYKSGLAQYQAGNIRAAIKELELAFGIDPGTGQFSFLTGECFFKLSDFRNAVKKYAEALQLNPAYDEAFKQRGLANFYLSNYEEAISDFSAAIKINPKRLQTYKYLGDAYLKNKQFTNAISNYEAALSLSKSSGNALDNVLLSDLYCNVAGAYLNSADSSRAIQNFNEALKIDVKNAGLYFDRGTAFLKYNELDRAEEDLRKAIELNGKVPLWYFRLGEVYQKKGKYAMAIDQFNISNSLSPIQSLSFDIAYHRAVCLAGLKKYAEALKDYKMIEAGKAEANYKNFNAELGDLYLKLANPDHALIYFDHAISKDSLNTSVVYRKAIAYVQKKQKEDAFTWLEKALSFTSGKLNRETVMDDFAALKNENRFKDLIHKFY